MSSKPKISPAPCNNCCRETDHKILKEQRVSDEDEGCDHSWDTTHRMLECQGCHAISLQRIVTTTAYDGVEIEYFPPPVSRRKPDWANDSLSDVPASIDALLTEVYAALHANTRRLAAMGARALLDMVMTDKIKDVGRFDQKLDALVSGAFVSQKQREFLEAALDAGSAASHRGYCPTARDLNLVMDIVESIIAQIYVLPEAAKQLMKSTPKRKKNGI
jgi:hypothetical protein